MRILLLTAVYPRPDAPKTTTSTKVIQYFAAAWRQMGHEVAVIHTVNRLPKVIYYLPGRLKAFIKKKTGYEVTDPSITREIDYTDGDIPVYRKCLFKAIPRRLTARRTVEKCAARIKNSLDAAGFVPELIVGHWASPNAQLLAALRRCFDCPNALVLHGDAYVRRFPDAMREAFSHIDRIGCRSAALSATVRELLGLDKTPFVCYSGIPNDYAAKMRTLPVGSFEEVTRFLYVGELIVRKRVDTVLRALATHKARPWQLDVVGVGACEGELRALAAELDIADRVTFHGRLPRERVLEMMSEAHVFTMVSRGEAFGLVYLEAMAAGCLTVGSCGEGIDGVIVDGENGFLCPAGDENALAELYRRIAEMTPQQRQGIAAAAKSTATAMSDSAVAARYLVDLTE